MAELTEHLCRDSPVGLRAWMGNGSPAHGAEQAGGEGNQLWGGRTQVALPEILPCVLDAFKRQSLLLWLTVRLVRAWLASAFQG